MEAILGLIGAAFFAAMIFAIWMLSSLAYNAIWDAFKAWKRKR